jgi:hypothetical protein
VNNGLPLAVSGRLEAQIFKQAQMLNRITNLEVTTEPAITQNGCYRLGFYKF